MPMHSVQTRRTSSVPAVVELVEKVVVQQGEQALVRVQVGLLLKAVQLDYGSFGVDQVVIAESAEYSVDQEVP